MDDFNNIVRQHTNEAFDNLTKAVKSMSDTEQQAYADKFPVAIWTVAGMNEEYAFAISAN